MFNVFKKNAIINRAQDELLYEYVTNELEDGIKIKGLWAKAYANSSGNENKIEPLYMQYRVQAIRDQFDTLKIAYDEMSRQRLFNYIKNGFNDSRTQTKNISDRRLKVIDAEIAIDECDFNDEGINKYTGTKYDIDGFTQNGFDKYGIHKITKSKYDDEGFDKSGYNKDFETRGRV